MLKSIFALEEIKRQLPLSPPFIAREMQDYLSAHTEETKSRYWSKPDDVTIVYPLLAAIQAYVEAEKKSVLRQEIGCAIGKTKEGAYCAEYPKGKMLHLVKAEQESGRWGFKACIVRKETKTVKGMATYSIGDGEANGEALFFALIPEFLKNDEFRASFEALSKDLERWNGSKEQSHLEECWKKACILSKNVYGRAVNPESCNAMDGSGMEIVCPTGRQMLLPSDEITESGVAEMYLSLSFSKFGGIDDAALLTPHTSARKYLVRDWTIKSLKNAFVRNPSRRLTGEELLMMQSTEAKLGEWYQIPEQLIKAAASAKETYGRSIAFSNFYFFGEAGGGKTSAAMALSLALGIPYVSVTFSANTEILDLLQSIAPETVGEDGRTMPMEAYLSEFPDALTCALEPEKAYEQVTGTPRKDARPEDVTMAICSQVAAKMSSTGQRFKYVDSPLAKAFRYGYLCELQEPNIVSNPGVIVGINSLLDRTASMVCQSGEVVTRHPDFVAVDTTNRSYAACRDVNASHLSRFHMALRFDKPDVHEMIRRVEANTGFHDEDTIRKMMRVVEAMCETLKNSGEENYSCGTRELCNWVLWYSLLGNAVEAAKDTIIPLATQNEELMSDLLLCVMTEFS